MDLPLPVIPAKRYFTIGEVGDLCGVKPHVLRYWEQEFTQLRPMKRRGNRRYYQHHEVLMIRKIRDLLYDQGFTISGARNKMQEMLHLSRGQKDDVPTELTKIDVPEPGQVIQHSSPERHQSYPLLSPTDNLFSVQQQLLEIRDLLTL
jgi:DNA-binding transcriptional MerR regulator